MSAPTKAPKKNALKSPTEGPAHPTDDALAAAAKKRAQAARKAKKRERAAAEERLAERIRLAEEAVIREQTAQRRGLGSRTRWIVGGVAAVLVFQVVHSAEHVAQATYWLFNPAMPAWMSPWAMSLINGLAAATGGTPALGMELLHLIGNALFLGGLLLAFRLPERYRSPTMLRWLRLATLVEAAHLVEHVLLTTSVAFLSKAVGLSTLFGAMTPGTPAAVGYRVGFHLAVNLVATFFALKAALAVRDRLRGRDATSTGRALDRVGYAVLAAPLAGVLFLLPIFGAHAGHSAAAGTDPATVVASVNGEDITSSDLEAAVQVALARPNAPILGSVGSGTQNMTEEQLRITTLNRLVQNTLTEQGAAAMGVTITAADVQARKVQLIEGDFFGQAGYEQFLADNNVSDEYATDQVRDLLLQERVHAMLTDGVQFTPEEVTTRFAAVYEGFPRALQLLSSNEAEANALLARAEAGEDFAELIRTHSLDPRAATTGGATGPIQEGAAVPELVQAVNSVPEGRFTVVQTQYGWHVIQRLAPATVAEVEEEIRGNLLLERQATEGQTWLRTLRDAAAVVLAPGYGVWDTEFGAVVVPAG